MHILLVTHYFAPENSAPTRRWAAFAERFIDHGHQVTVVAPPPHYPQGRVKDGLKQQYKPGSSAIEEYGANVFRTKYLQHRADIVSRTSDHLVAAYDSLGVAKRAAKQFGPPEVVIATAPGIPSLIAGRRIAKAFGAPLIVEMRDAWPDLVTHTAGLSGGGPKKWVKKIIHERITDWQLHSAQVVTTTQRFAEVLGERGVSSPVVIRNGTNIERYGNIGERTGNDRLHLLYMGNMGRSQGLHTVIEAAAKLKAQGVPIEVRFVGHGADKPRLRQLNKAHGWPVEIRDQVEPNEVHEHYAWADSLIVSLRDWEPFEWTVPSKLYEALATGRHITGLLAGEAASVLRSARGGEVIEPGNADQLASFWRELANRPGLLKVSSSAVEWASEHANYDTLASRYLDLIEEIVAGCER